MNQKKKEKADKEIKEKISTEQEYLNGWKRCQADFENYRKAQDEARKEFAKYVAETFILQIIPVLDNFHMATEHIPQDQKDGGWVAGIMHIQKQLENVLAENGVEEIMPAAGDEFDPMLHEAVEDGDKKQEISSKKEIENKIKKVLVRGYKMGDKVIRPSKVIVR